MSISKSDPVVIVGAGAFGLSTALHLVQCGHSNISVFERDDRIPSRYSAANDLNKIVRAEYENEFYTDLTVRAIAAWKTPLFAPHFHQTGFLHCVSGAAPEKAVSTLARFQASAEKHPQLRPHVVHIQGEGDVRQTCWQFNGPLPGWRGYLNRFDGYAHSANTLRAVYSALQGAGVRFFLGNQGAIREIVYEGTVDGRKAVGVRTEARSFHPAALVIIAAGASASRLVPELGKQVVAKSWSVTHVHLTDDETSALRGIPVTYARDLGFFFEPDPKTNLLKLCPMGGGYINTDPATGVSHAPDSLSASAFLPDHDRRQLRRLLAHTLPALADRPFVNSALCWFADTSNSDFIVDYVPRTSKSVLLLSGDSGHGFKMFPILGSFVTDILKSSENQQSIARWRWRHPSSKEKEAHWTGDISWRLGESKELSEIRSPELAKL